MLANLDAEKAIIGSAINDAQCASKLAACPETLFSDTAHRALHRAIQRLVKTTSDVDIVTLAAEARVDLPEPEQLCIDCASRGFVPSAFGQYEGILQDCAKRRALADAAQRIAQDVGNPAADINALSAELVERLRAEDGRGTSVSMHDALMAFLDALEHAKDTRAMSGIAALDRLMGGFLPGSYVAIGARPGVGKSAVAMRIAVNIARTRGQVLIVSLEMPPEEIVRRIVASESGIDSHRMTTGDLDADAYTAMAATYADIGRMPVRVSSSATPLEVRREAVKMKQHGGLSAIVIDYVQLMRTNDRTSSRYEAVSSISRELKLLALELKVPIFVLTQFNRDSTKTMGRAQRTPPQMYEARDSGAIEQDADVFLTLFDPPAPTEPGTPGWETWGACNANGWDWLSIIVAKNRHGPCGVVHVGFDKPRMRIHTIFDGGDQL